MNIDNPGELTRNMMRRQLRLSLSVAAIFVLVLAGLPLVNLYLPELAATKVGGFTVTWLILGLLFYPLTWVLSAWFVRGSEAIEGEVVKEQLTKNQ
jgi:uncharacterized membrane protein (DUF485 family)